MRTSGRTPFSAVRPLVVQTRSHPVSLVFFISHAHEDEPIARALLDFFTLGVGVEKKEMRCTSVLSTGLMVGDDIAKKLRRDIKACEYFVPLITKHSGQSEFVGFEMGAAWAFDSRVVPLVFSTAKSVALPSVFAHRLSRKLLDEGQLVALAQELSGEIFVSRDRPSPTEMRDAARSFLQNTRPYVKPRPTTLDSAWTGGSGRKK